MAELIDGHISVKECGHAVAALMEYALKQQEKREENELLPGKEESIWLQIAVKEIHGEAKLKPHRMCVGTPRSLSLGLCFVWADSPIKHPLVDPRTSAVCLITKDPQREYKDLLEEAGVRFINRVVGIEKLKGKFKSFEARRALLHENALFLADERVIPLLPRLLGKIFFTAKKFVSFLSALSLMIQLDDLLYRQPIPVCLKRKDLKGELERAIFSTYMHQNRGTCTCVPHCSAIILKG